MPSIDDIFEKAVTDRVIPGAILAASSTDGLFKYNKAFGFRSLKEGESKPLEVDAVLWVGSVTKIMTAIAALQCVEQGYFSLDEDVTRIVPELAHLDLKTESKVEGEPPFPTKTKNSITLRKLLTHTSGLSYTNFGKLELPFLERCLSPLVFEPGEGFIYGTGHDFAGLMVERVTGLSLEQYLQQHVAGPLDIHSVCFHPLSYPELHHRIPDVSLRAPNKGSVYYTDNPIWPLEINGDSGGSGAYISIIDFQKILHCLNLNDGKLLKPETANELFKPDMYPPVRAGVMEAITDANRNNIYGGLPMGTEVTYSMGGMIILEGLPGRRPKGTLHWGGLLNVFFWIDKLNGLSGIFATQVYPAGDPQCLELFAEFERKAYEIHNAAKAKN